MKAVILLICVVSLWPCCNGDMELKAVKTARQCSEKTSAYIQESLPLMDSFGVVLNKIHDPDDAVYNSFVNTAQEFLKDDLDGLRRQLGSLQQNCVTDVDKRLVQKERLDAASVALVERDCETSRLNHGKMLHRLRSKVERLLSMKKYYDRFGPAKAGSGK